MNSISSTLKNLRGLIETFPKKANSVVVVSPFRVETQIARWKTYLPNVSPFYAVKSNPCTVLLTELSNRGIGFDCASLQEVYAVKKLNSSSILYAHPMKSENEITAIDSLNIETTVVDSVEESLKLDALGWAGSALVRVAVDDTKSDMPFSSKFGASMKEVTQIAEASKIPITGVSFHVGSGCKDPKQYTEAIKYAGGPIFSILKQYKHHPTIVDIGGGFSSKRENFLPVVEAILNAPLHRRIKMIAEPGRYFSEGFQDLFVKVIAKKPGLDGKGWRYVINESLYGYFSCIPFDKQRPSWIVFSSNRYKSTKKESSVIFGRTCDSLDVIAKGNMEEMEVGDWLYFPLMGSYTNSSASEFNGFPKPHKIIDTNDLLPDLDVAWEMKESADFANKYEYIKSL